jgi:hypothetical protein
MVRHGFTKCPLGLRLCLNLFFTHNAHLSCKVSKSFTLKLMNSNWQSNLEQDIVQMAKDLNHLIMEFYDETDKINSEMAELHQQAMEAGEDIA